MRLCISNGLIIDPDSGFHGVGDLWTRDDRITSISTHSECYGQIPPGELADLPPGKYDGFRKIDATGKLVIPGLIDLHVHFREPGAEYKEDIESGAMAAARGGYTTVCVMPNTTPVTDSAEAVEYIKKRAKEACGVHIVPVGAITKGQLGREMCDFRTLAQAGAGAFSEDGKSVADSQIMLEALKEAAEIGLPVLEHAEDASADDPALAEELMVARDILLAKTAGAPIHFCHISSAKSLEMIRRAKEEGVAVTCETAPHYIMFTEDDVNGNTNMKMNPPLHSYEDRAAIIAALMDGTIDAIATDHAPHSKEEKAQEFAKAPNGVIGVDVAFAVSFTRLVQNGRMSLDRIVELMSTAPAKILGIPAGSLASGRKADIAVFDMEGEYEITEDDFSSKSKNSPFISMKVSGRAIYTIADGEIIWEHR